MNDSARLLAVVCALWWGRTGGAKPNGGYCIGHQCFTVSKKPGTFTAALSECGNLGGHLMTARSSASQDVLSLLLGNASGRFWIGLHLPSGCPDQSLGGLGGFRWVTGGSESDFSNWPSAFDASCSSRRCVSVSPVDDFKWTREPCERQAAGFLCEFSFNATCAGLEAAAGETPAYGAPVGIEGGDLLSLPPGSVAVLTPSEAKYICLAGRWTRAPWRCDVLEGGCEHKCTLDPERQAPLCYCPRGQAVNPENGVACDAAQGDPCASLRCAHACHERGGSYACACRRGFELAADGRSCAPIDGCADARPCPGDNSRCVDTAGGPRCVCADGYKKVGGVCVDENECASAPCEHKCKNVPGSYRCSCFKGYKEDPEDPHKCQLHCGEAECPAECDPNDGFICYCPGGYILEEREQQNVCIDMNECTFSFCDQHCRNTYGSYACACSPGYTLLAGSKCVKTGDEPEAEGPGASSTFPSVTSEPPRPDPSGRPSSLTSGGLAGVLLCALFFVALMVFLAYRVARGRKTTEAKAPESEAHTLQPMTPDA